MAGSNSEMHDGWIRGKYTVENGLWIHTDREQVERTRERVNYDLSEFEIHRGTHCWLILTQRGVVFVETWKPNVPDCPPYIGFHMWIPPYHYWQRTHDTFPDTPDGNKARRAAARAFAEVVARKIVRSG
jgi:hypothetical protein